MLVLISGGTVSLTSLLVCRYTRAALGAVSAAGYLSHGCRDSLVTPQRGLRENNGRFASNVFIITSLTISCMYDMMFV